MAIIWERIRDPQDRRKTVWWRGTEEGCDPAYLSVGDRQFTGSYEWAVRRAPGVGNVVVRGRAATLAKARQIAAQNWPRRNEETRS